jgi:hypothetical protein
MEEPEKFDQDAMDQVTDKVLAFRPKKATKVKKKKAPNTSKK